MFTTPKCTITQLRIRTQTDPRYILKLYPFSESISNILETAVLSLSMKKHSRKMISVESDSKHFFIIAFQEANNYTVHNSIVNIFSIYYKGLSNMRFISYMLKANNPLQ